MQTVEIPRTQSGSIASGCGFIDVASDGVEWTMRADLVDQLLPAVRRSSSVGNSDRTVQTVKTGPHRTVYRLALPGGDFYLKHFRVTTWKTVLQNLLRPTKAELEWNAARRIADLGLPTFEPVAIGRVRWRGLVVDSFLISRGIQQAIPLDEFAGAEFEFQAQSRITPERTRLRQKLTIALGELTARLHLAAVEHADFHAANVLVRIGDDGTPALYLIDLHRVHFRAELTSDQRFRNLAFLHQFFCGKSSRTDRLRFYRAYQRIWHRRNDEEASLNRDTSARAEIAAMEDYLTQGAQRGWRRADRAWRRGNRQVRKLDSSSGGCRGLAILDGTWLKSVRDEPERLLAENVVAWHKQTGKHRVAEIQLYSRLATPHGTAFFKSIEHQSTWRRWLGIFRDSPVRKGWEIGHALLRRLIDTPRPILFVERAAAGSRKYYLLTEAIPDSTNLTDFLTIRWPELTIAERQTWLDRHRDRLASQVRRLHDGGFDHRDLKFANLLVSKNISDPRIWFIDLDGIRTWKRLPEVRAAQNLARISVSAQAHGLASLSNRLRFLKHYLGDRSVHDWKWWWRKIGLATERKLAANKRRGRATQ